MKKKAWDCATGKFTEINIYTDEERTKDFKDTIWKHKIYGNKVRVHNWNQLWEGECCSYFVYFKNGEKNHLMRMEEFKFLYERIGKAKYDRFALDKLEYEVEEKDENQHR